MANNQFPDLPSEIQWNSQQIERLQRQITYLTTIVNNGGGGGNSQPDTQVLYGTGSGITSSDKFTYNEATGELKVLNDSSNIAFNIDTVNDYYSMGHKSGMSYMILDGANDYFLINLTGGARYLTIEPNSGNYQFGDITPTGNGTNLYLNDTNKVSISTNAVATPTMQIETGGGDVTINDGVRGLYYDPPTLVTAATITLPANPIDGQEILIILGGTITNGAVISTPTIAANVGQVLISATAGGVSTIGNKAGIMHITKYRADITAWYI